MPTHILHLLLLTLIAICISRVRCSSFLAVKQCTGIKLTKKDNCRTKRKGFVGWNYARWDSIRYKVIPYCSNLPLHLSTSGTSHDTELSDSYLEYDVPPDRKLSHNQIEQAMSSLHLLLGPLTNIKGIGPSTATAFSKLKLYRPIDLLFHFPVKIQDYGCDFGVSKNIKSSFIEVSDRDKSVSVCLELTVEGFFVGKNIHKAITRDKAGNRVDVLFFHRTRKGLFAAKKAMEKMGSEGSKRIVFGKAKQNFFGGTFQCFDLVNPVRIDSVAKTSEDHRPVDSMSPTPVYKLTKGVTQKRMATAIEGAFVIGQPLLDILPDILPRRLLDEMSWTSRYKCLRILHSPKSDSDVGVHATARRHLAFEAMCVQQARLGLSRYMFKTSKSYGPERGIDLVLRETWDITELRREDTAVNIHTPLLHMGIKAFPFDLTLSQQKALNEIFDDSVRSDQRMIRLLQGDVGSGKTAVACLAGLSCLDAKFGKVVVMLSPTTILAEQHVNNLSRIAKSINEISLNVGLGKKVNVCSYTGSMKSNEREKLLRHIEMSKDDGEVFFLVGTHALLSSEVAERLSSNVGIALSVIDEEQRFGVNQRTILSDVSRCILYMTATPIPRTVALRGSNVSSPTLVGAIDVSTIDYKPENARHVTTKIIDESKLEDLMYGVKKQVEIGAKIIWILPRIGEENNNESDIIDDEVNDVSCVINRHLALSDLLGESCVSYVHGQLSEDERMQRISEFSDPDSGVNVIVGTTVLEVGIDIPLVTILIVEKAERFGLSQLHQLRGRVGRPLPNGMKEHDKLKCHFALITSCDTSTDKPSSQRLKILATTTDSNKIAEEDFRIRGQGDLFGTLQAGTTKSSCIDVNAHFGMIQAASWMGRSIFREGASKKLNDAHRIDRSDHQSNQLILDYYNKHKLSPYFTNAMETTSISGFTLRVLMCIYENPYESIITKEKSLSLNKMINTLSEINAETSSDNAEDTQNLFTGLLGDEL